MTDTEKKAHKFFSKLTMAVNAFEIIFTAVVPIYLWGWLRGLLVASALTSALHIVLLLKRLILSVNVQTRTINEFMQAHKGSRIIRP